MPPSPRARATAPQAGAAPDRPSETAAGATQAERSRPCPRPEPALGRAYGSCSPPGPTDSATGRTTPPFTPDRQQGAACPASPSLRAVRATIAAHWPQARVAFCEHLRPGAELEIGRYIDRPDSGHVLRGTTRCNDPWLCPLCGVFIAHARADQIARAAEAHRADGGRIALLTLTQPHARADDLAELLRVQNEAWRCVKRWRAWRELAAEIELRGTIAAREATWSYRAGWHPHLHVLLLVGREAAADDLQHRIAELWARAVERAGGRTPGAHGCHVTIRDDADAPAEAGQYLAKGAWHEGNELAGSAKKVARAGRYTPAQLMHALHACHTNGQPRAARHWRAIIEQYRAAYRGRQVIAWSKGLKAELGVRECDEPEPEIEQGAFAATAVMGRWGAELARRHELQVPLRQAADRDGYRGVQRLMAAYNCQVGLNSAPMIEALGAMEPPL